MEPHFDQCLTQLRSERSDLYLPILFLAKSDRAASAALYCFHHEIDRISYLVNEPMAGEIRLQWWREALSGERAGEAQANPLAKALLEVIDRYQLPLEGFIRYLDARIFDLYQDPMPAVSSLEAYCGQTSSFILQMSAISTGIDNDRLLADICGHGGVGIGIADMLRRLKRDLIAQRVFIPQDILALSGITSSQWLGPVGPSHHHCVKAFIDLGKTHLAKANDLVAQIDNANKAVFLPLIVAEKKISAADKGEALFNNELELSALSLQWALWKKALIG